jgi:cell division GTPase FtsZ
MSENHQRTGLLLLGVGGGGCRLAASVRAAYGEGLRVLCADTDAQPLRTAAGAGMPTVLLGGSRLSGHGTGGDAILGRLAAQDDIETLRAQMQHVRTVVVLASLVAARVAEQRLKS